MKTDTVKPIGNSKETSKKQLRPDAPAFIPFQKILENLLLFQQLHVVEKEPQCSRYSRKSIRVSMDSQNSQEQQENINPENQSPRPILGNAKTVSPRAILGRKENLMPLITDSKKQPQKIIAKEDDKKHIKAVKVEENTEQEDGDEDDDGLANMGKEYRSVYRRIQRLKILDEVANKKTVSNINAAIVSTKKKGSVNKS